MKNINKYLQQLETLHLLCDTKNKLDFNINKVILQYVTYNIKTLSTKCFNL